MDLLSIFPAFLAAADPAAAPEASGLVVIANKFGLQPQIILAQAVNFLLVAYVLWRFAIKPVVATVDERQARIAEGLQNAEEMKLRLEEAETEKENTLREASVEAQRIVKEAQEQAKTKVDRSVDEARRAADDILRRAEESIEADRKKMVEETRSEIARLVVLTSSRVLDRELSADERERFTESAGEALSRN